MPASSAAPMATYSEPLLVEISFCANSIGGTSNRLSLDEYGNAWRERVRVAVARAAAVRVRGDVLDEVAPDVALVRGAGKRPRLVVGAARAVPAGDVEGREVVDRHRCLAAAVERGEVRDHQLHDPRIAVGKWPRPVVRRARRVARVERARRGVR